NPSTGTAVALSDTSSLWSTVTGDNSNQYPNIYHVIYNHITDGALGLPPNPTIIGGEKMFISDTATPTVVEYFAPTINNQILSVANMYFIDANWQDIPNTFWSKGKISGSTIIPG